MASETKPWTLEGVKRWLPAAVVCASALAACRGNDGGEPPTAGVAFAAPPIRMPTAVPAQPVPSAPSASSWTFVAFSDLHIPNSAEATATVKRLVAAVVEMKPRVVVITGDFTNGSPKGGVSPKWWPAVLDALAPL